MNIKGKKVWITGATSGIGEALVRELDGQAELLFISARRVEVLEKIKSECQFPERIELVPLDLSDPSSVSNAIDVVKGKTDSLDLLINNAGVSQRSEIAETTMDVDRRIMEVNYFGNIEILKGVLGLLRKSGTSKVVVVSSLAGKFGFFQRSAYAASKHALHGFYDALRFEEESNGIAVLIVCPSFVNTNMPNAALDGSGQASHTNDQRLSGGISPEACAKHIVKAIGANKHEIVIGGKGKIAVFLKKCFPNLFFNVMRRQKP